MIFESFKKHFVPKEEIRFLDGGEIRGPEYYLVSKEADVMCGKLRVQWASQKPTPAFRQGFEPFRSPHGDHKFCISTSTIPVPRLQDSEWQKPGSIWVGSERIEAGIILRVKGSEVSMRLNALSKRFGLQNYIRNFVARNQALFPTVLSLLEVGNCKTPPTLRERVNLFEWRLKLAEDSMLVPLVGLLKLETEDPTRRALAA